MKNTEFMPAVVEIVKSRKQISSFGSINVIFGWILLDRTEELSLILLLLKTVNITKNIY